MWLLEEAWTEEVFSYIGAQLSRIRALPLHILPGKTLSKVPIWVATDGKHTNPWTWVALQSFPRSRWKIYDVYFGHLLGPDADFNEASQFFVSALLLSTQADAIRLYHSPQYTPLAGFPAHNIYRALKPWKWTTLAMTEISAADWWALPSAQTQKQELHYLEMRNLRRAKEETKGNRKSAFSFLRRLFRA